MSFLQALLADGPPPIPPPPPSYNVQFWSANLSASARVSARQTALEAGVGGVDHAFSVSFWMIPHNVNEGTLVQRIMGVMETALSGTQWLLSLVAQSSATANQCLAFTLFNTGLTANIQIISSSRMWRARATHVVATYDGSEVNTGFKLYFNGVQDTGATLAGSGVYSGCGDDVDYRFQIGPVFANFGQYAGRCRDVGIWNRVITAGEVVDLFNNDVPVDVTSLPFYAGAITAFWPLHTDAACLQGAGAYDLTRLNVSTTSYPIASSYPYFGQCNAIPGNTRYVAFGSIYQESNLVWRGYQRSGTDHLANGKIVKIVADVSSGKPVFTGPTDVITNALDIRSAQAALIDGDVYVFSALYNTGTGLMTDCVYWQSTDGDVGEAFGSPVSVASLLPTFTGYVNTYGKIIQGPGAGEHMVIVYGKDSAGPTSWIGYLKRDVAGVWSYVSMYSGATEFNETTILNCGGGVFISVSRCESANGLFMMKSTDGAGAVWSAPASTGLGTGRSMGDLVMTNAVGGSGPKIVLIMGDRGTNLLSVSFDNVLADLLADETDWNALSQVYKGYGTTALFLGYPSIRSYGALGASFWSDEFSGTRADLFFAYGQLQYT